MKEKNERSAEPERRRHKIVVFFASLAILVGFGLIQVYAQGEPYLIRDDGIHGAELWTINGSPASVNCTYAISRTSDSSGASGGPGSVDITSSSSACGWTATSNVSWITVTSGSTGTGNGTVSYSVAANPGTYQRIGTLTIAGNTFYIMQVGAKAYHFAAQWGIAGTGDGQFSSPAGIAIDSSGYIYVADSGNNRIQKFDSDGNFINKWGTVGIGDGQFNSPSGIAVVPAGYVFVVDSGNNRIQKFDSTGAFLFWWSPCISLPSGCYGNSLMGLAADSSGNLYASVNNNIYEFDDTGNKVHDGWFINAGRTPQRFAVAVDLSNQIYVSSFLFRYGAYEEIVKFDPKTFYVENYIAWGSYGSDDGQFNGIRGIAIDKAGSVYVVDSGNNRIQKFGLNAETSGDTLPVYRFRNKLRPERLFTIYESEKTSILQDYPDYLLEGVAFYAYQTWQPGTFPVYRFRNTQYPERMYTIYESEKDFILQNYPQFVLEGVSFYAYQTQLPGTMPVYRFRNTQYPERMYTIYESEKDSILQDYPQYLLEGVGFYAYQTP